MADVDRLINRFIDNEIRLSKADIMASAKSRNWLLDRIQSKIQSKSNSLCLHPQVPFYNFGSYFKGTKVKVVDEYDVLVVIDSYGGQFLENGKKLADGLGVASPNPQYNGQYNLQGTNNVSTSKNLNWLKAITQEVVSSFGGEAPERNGQAITATIKSSNIKIDLVPAGIFQDIKTKDVFFIIPAGDKNNSWIKTNPEKDKEIIDYFANGRNDFKNLIRLLKFIRDSYIMKISSFTLECCAAYYANTYKWQSISVNFVGMLIYFRDCLRAKQILDTYDKEVNLIEDLSTSDWYADRIETIIDNIILLESVTNENDAYVNLYNILNNL